MPVIVQFGAGNIGRSLVGQLFARAGWEVVFVDVASELVAALNQRRRYLVQMKDRQPEDIWVDGVRAVSGLDEAAVVRELAGADLAATAVGPAVLSHLHGVFARALEQRTQPLSIILCENLRGATQQTRTGVANLLPAGFPLEERLGLVATSIGKMVPIMPTSVRQQDPLLVWAEAYNQIVADRQGFIGQPPDVPGLVVKDNFEAYVDRKLFIHNLGHATSAYHGYLAGASTIAQAMEIDAVAEAARQAMNESGQALMGRYPCEFSQQSQQEHIEDLLARFHNHALGDTVFRVGRDLVRKLGPEDRFVGALKLDLEQDIEPRATATGLAAGLLFQGRDDQGRMLADDEQFITKLEQHGPAWALAEVCGLDAGDPLQAPWVNEILRAYEHLKGTMKT